MRAATVFRIVGLLMLAYGVGTLILMQTDHRQWALDHSLAEIVSWSDRRVDNEISGSVDEPIVYAGAGVMIFAGLWFGLLIPRVFNNWDRQQRAMYQDDAAVAGSPPDPPSDPTA